MRAVNRREMLGRAGALASLAVPTPSAAPPFRKLKVVVTGGHPGDPEYGCGGTIARYTDLGHDVGLLYLNDGVPSGKPKNGVRVAEAAKACEILKARPLFAGQADQLAGRLVCFYINPAVVGNEHGVESVLKQRSEQFSVVRPRRSLEMGTHRYSYARRSSLVK